jgi:hypothetical protein
VIRGLLWLLRHLPHAVAALARFLWCVLAVWHRWEAAVPMRGPDCVCSTKRCLRCGWRAEDPCSFHAFRKGGS